MGVVLDTVKYIDLGNNYGFEYNQAMSLSIWGYFNNVTKAALITKYDSFSPFRGWDLFIDATKIIYEYYSGGAGGSAKLTTNAALSISTLYHIVATRPVSADVNNWRVYVNGVSQAFTINVNTLNGTVLNAVNAEIGRRLYTTYYTNGYLFDARIYNVELTEPQVKTIYESKGSDNITTGLVGRWLLNDAPSGVVMTSALDISGSGINGTPIASPVCNAVPMKLIK